MIMNKLSVTFTKLRKFTKILSKVLWIQRCTYKVWVWLHFCGMVYGYAFSWEWSWLF